MNVLDNSNQIVIFSECVSKVCLVLYSAESSLWTARSALHSNPDIHSDTNSTSRESIPLVANRAYYARPIHSRVCMLQSPL